MTILKVLVTHDLGSGLMVSFSTESITETEDDARLEGSLAKKLADAWLEGYTDE